MVLRCRVASAHNNELHGFEAPQPSNSLLIYIALSRKPKRQYNSCHCREFSISAAKEQYPLTERQLSEVESTFQDPENQWNSQASVHYPLQPGTKPNPSAFASLLRFSGNAKCLSDLQRIHHQVVQSGKEQNGFLGSLIVQMYMNCGAVDDARSWFARMQERNVFSWTFIIAEHANAGRGKDAVELFHQMLEEAVVPDHYIFNIILSACVSENALILGKRTHARLKGSGYDTQLVVGNTLVNMYSRCGSLDDAQRMFDTMSERNVVSWTCIISAYAQYGCGKKAFLMFEQMHREGVIPNKVTFLSIIDACTYDGALGQGKHVHEYIRQSGLSSDVVIASALVTMYGKCASLEDARNTFEEMPERNVVSWNAMIAVFAEHGFSKEALRLLDLMRQQGFTPDKVTYINLLDSYGSPADLAEGTRMHNLISRSGYEYDVEVATALVNMYGRCSSLGDARGIFDRMPERNMVSWNFMLGAYARHGQVDDAIQLFEQMKQEALLPDKFVLSSVLSACAGQVAVEKGTRVHAVVVGTEYKSDIVVSTALLNMYSKCGSLEHARSIFDSMPKRDSFSWNAMIAGFAQYGHGKDALKFFNCMLNDGLNPDKVTFVSVLSACASQAALTTGKLVHNCIICRRLESDIVVATAIVNLYAKCGTLEDSWRMFNNMSERNVVSWSSMMAAYAQHGHGKDVLHLFHQMLGEGIRPNEVTFVCVLSACSHAGLLDEGRYWWLSMKRDHSITPLAEHYDCMIDLLCRVGCLDEAEGLIMKMPFQPTAVSWMTLLGACRNKVDVKRGERAALRMFDMDSKDPSAYVMLSNLYLATGRVNDSQAVMNIMKRKGLKKPPGCSSIEVDGQVYEFLADDQSHPHKDEIYAELYRLTEQIKEAGYAPDMKLVLDGSENEKEPNLSSHSEKLAIAFGFIRTPPGAPLLITKNLRVCLDCHSFIKYVSKIAHRQLVVRDAHRFHHIKDGVCSCSDYW